MMNEAYEKEFDPIPNNNLSLENEKCNLGRIKNGSVRSIKNDVQDNLKKTFCPPALVVRNASKSYEASSQVLNNLSMTVQSGTIYALLGSSGCGKTTLLSCCVGVQNLDSGDIRVLGKAPGSKGSEVPGRLVGYMPQDISLHTEFTIEESFTYFGQVFGMSSTQIKSSMEFLLKLLDLPKATRKIQTLSGGQKRRVSFGLTIFHNPPLLILDEPTVGVDPLLRESIWTHLRQLVTTKQMTVIITTHYIEEARQSHAVGLMRSGRLLAEKSPADLLVEHQVAHLDQVVLKLCLKDNRNDSDPCFILPSIAKPTKHKTCEDVTILKVAPLQQDQLTVSCERPTNDIQEIDALVSSQASSSSKIESFKSSMIRMKALIRKNFLVMRRNLFFLLFMLVNPAIQIMLICLAIGPDPMGINIGVINNELVNSTSAICEPVSGCEYPFLLSCSYLQMIPKDSINLISYESEEIAVAETKKGNLWGYLSFPHNFSSAMIDRSVSGAYASNETLDESRISFQMDMSNKQVGLTLKRIFFETFLKFLESSALACGSNPRQSELPLYFKTPIYGSEDISFRTYIAPSTLMGVLFFFPLCASSIFYISEKKAGTLQRSLVLGVTDLEIMIAFVTTQAFLLLGQASLVFAILVLVFNIQIIGSVVLAVALSILIGIAGLSMGFLAGTICEEEIQAILLVMGTFVPNLLLAGMFWPLEAMPLAMQYVGYFLPCTLACEAMRSIVSRGWFITDTSVWLGFVSTLGWIVVYWIITILTHRLTNKK